MADAVSHDQNFKNLFLDYPRQALAFFAPEEAPAPDDEVSILPVRQEQLKERLGDRFRELDAPLLVEWADGRAPIVFALEAESDARRFSPRRLARYCLDLADMFDTDRVVPVVVFLRSGAAPGPLTPGTGRRAYLPFDYLACALGDLPAERWMDSDNVVARVNLPNMRYPAERRVDVYAPPCAGCWSWRRTLSGARSTSTSSTSTRASRTMSARATGSDIPRRATSCKESSSEPAMRASSRDASKCEASSRGPATRASAKAVSKASERSWSGSYGGASARSPPLLRKGCAKRRRPTWRPGRSACSTRERQRRCSLPTPDEPRVARACHPNDAHCRVRGPCHRLGAQHA